jgi:hypothetical protein
LRISGGLDHFSIWKYLPDVPLTGLPLLDTKSIRVLARYNASMLFRSSRIFILAVASCFLMASFSQAQQSTSQAVPDQPPQKPPADASGSSVPAPHAFWDRTNILLFTGVGVFRGLDYASTRNFQARGREEILIPDDVVNNSAGFASLEAAATAASVGLSYWMHRAGHHKLERWISIVHIGITGFGVARNYSLKSDHTPR